MVFKDFHLSEGLRKGGNGSRFSKQNSIQNPPKINPNSLKNRSWRPKAIKHRSWRPKNPILDAKIAILEAKMAILEAKMAILEAKRAILEAKTEKPNLVC